VTAAAGHRIARRTVFCCKSSWRALTGKLGLLPAVALVQQRSSLFAVWALCCLEHTQVLQDATQAIGHVSSAGTLQR
jgi:hypothetical protein